MFNLSQQQHLLLCWWCWWWWWWCVYEYVMALCYVLSQKKLLSKWKILSVSTFPNPDIYICCTHAHMHIDTHTHMHTEICKQTHAHAITKHIKI